MTVIRRPIRAASRLLPSRARGFLQRFARTPGDRTPRAPFADTTISPEDRAIIDRVRSYTMTGEPRIAALLDAVDYLVRRGVPGAFVECGVWRGGSILAMILKLQQLGAAPRDIYLYDTFEGMTTPTELDTSAYSEPAIRTWQRAVAAGERPWGHLLTPEQFNEANVRSLLESTGYPTESLHFVRGPVEETLPDHAPERISLLRLDTDWYESTRHELVHLFPRLQPGGVLIVDDYGHWEGCRRAVDEYFTSQATPLFLSRVDYAARIGVKVL